MTEYPAYFSYFMTKAAAFNPCFEEEKRVDGDMPDIFHIVQDETKIRSNNGRVEILEAGLVIVFKSTIRFFPGRWYHETYDFEKREILTQKNFRDKYKVDDANNFCAMCAFIKGNRINLNCSACSAPSPFAEKKEELKVSPKKKSWFSFLIS